MYYLQKLISITYTNAREIASQFINREYYPVPRIDSDLFIVEFPKSGGTWLSFLIANANLLVNLEQTQVTLFNINDLIPDVQSFRFMPPSSSTKAPGYRVFKSHATYNRRYRKIVYLARDPRHVMVSYWIFLRELGQWTGSFEMFVRNRRYGIRAWREHVGGWMEKIDAAASFTVLRYEDLLLNADAEIQRLYRFFGLPLSGDLVGEAVKRSRIENLREIESEYNSRHPTLGNMNFFRKGNLGGMREQVSEAALQYIEENAGDIMKKLGYECSGGNIASRS